MLETVEMAGMSIGSLHVPINNFRHRETHGECLEITVWSEVVPEGPLGKKG